METSPQALDPWDMTPGSPTSRVLLWPLFQAHQGSVSICTDSLCALDPEM